MEKKFKVDYDSEEDVLYMYLDRRKSKESLEVAEDIVLDMDSKGEIAGFEFFNAFKFLNKLNKEIKKEMLSKLREAFLDLDRYKGYWLITLRFQYNGQTIKERLPAFSTAQYESPLVAYAGN